MILLNFMDKIDVETPRRLYFDLEKLFKAYCLYDGHIDHPLELLEKQIHGDLEAYFKSNPSDPSALGFHIGLDQIFTDSISIVMNYGIDFPLSQIFRNHQVSFLSLEREILPSQLRRWCLKVRDLSRVEKSTGPSLLSTFFWSNPLPHIRTHLATKIQECQKKNQKPAKNDLISAWHKRNDRWMNAGAEHLTRGLEATKPMSAEEFSRLKHLVETYRDNLFNPNASLLSESENTILSTELGKMDSSQIQESLTAWNLSAVDYVTRDLESNDQSLKDELLANALKILQDFRPGSILLLFRYLQAMDLEKLFPIKSRILHDLKNALLSPESMDSVIDATSIAERLQTAIEILELIDPDRYTIFIDHCIVKNQRPALILFLERLIAKNLDFESLLWSWGEERLAKLIPAVQRTQWSRKEAFFEKAILSTYPPLVRASSRNLLSIRLPETLAFDLFKKLPVGTQELWIRVFKESPMSDAWRPFLLRLAKSMLWIGLPNESRQKSIEVFLRYLRGTSLPLLDSWISARSFRLWPKYVELRQLILSILLDHESDDIRKEIQEICRRESRVFFQDPELKDRLKRRGGLVK